MNTASASFQLRKFDKWIFGIGVLATPIGLGSDFLEGYTGIFLSFFPPVGLLVWGLYFAFIPAAIILLIRAVSLRSIGARMRIRILAGVGLVVAVGLLGLGEDRLRITLHGFLAQLKSHTSAPAFQTVALQIMNGETNTQGLVTFVGDMNKTNLMPAFAKRMFWGGPPRLVSLSPPADGAPGCYSMQGGGHFIGFFCVSAGPDSYKPDKRFVEEWIEWKPGVYVWWRFG